MVGARRSQVREPQSDTSSDTSAQAAVAVALIGSVGASQGAFVAAVAPLLLPFVSLGLLADVEITGDIAEEAAKLLHEADSVPVPNTGFSRTAALEALSYRAAYARAAVGRLSWAVMDAGKGQKGQALGKALQAEKRYLAVHMELTRKRLAGARVVDGLVELHGPILSWNWGATRMPDEPRPNHKAADGMSWDTRRGIPMLTGAIPGVLAGCSCAAGPPRPGARMLI